MKKIISSVFDSFGLQISRRRTGQDLGAQPRNTQMFRGLARLQQLNIPVRTLVDVGAAAGTWSLAAVELWPESEYLLFEPLYERTEELKALEKKYSNFHFVPAAAGRARGEVFFYVADDLDGSGVADLDPVYPSARKVDVKSIDEEVACHSLKGFFLVKLDTHGFEIPILEGCRNILPEISTFIIECYGFQIAENSLLFWEMCRYMDQLGFRVFDIVDIMNRPRDGAFWQCDVFFC